METATTRISWISVQFILDQPINTRHSWPYSSINFDLFAFFYFFLLPCLALFVIDSRRLFSLVTPSPLTMGKSLEELFEEKRLLLVRDDRRLDLSGFVLELLRLRD